MKVCDWCGIEITFLKDGKSGKWRCFGSVDGTEHYKVCTRPKNGFEGVKLKRRVDRCRHGRDKAWCVCCRYGRSR